MTRASLRGTYLFTPGSVLNAMNLHFITKNKVVHENESDGVIPSKKYLKIGAKTEVNIFGKNLECVLLVLQKFEGTHDSLGGEKKNFQRQRLA